MKKSIADDDLCVKVYDPENKKLIGVYECYAKAGIKLGIDGKVIYQKSCSKRRVYSPLLKMNVAVRLSKLGEEEKILIKKTAKYQKL